MRHVKFAALASALAVSVAACGGGTPVAEEDDDTTTPTSTAEETTSTTDAADEEIDTLAELFGYADFDDPEAAEARFQEEQTRIQELVRVCMAQEGFEYIPAVPPSGGFAFDERSEEEYVREQGFGITTWYGNEEQFIGPEPAIEWVDPNQEIVEAMSDSERDAYYEALYGPPDFGEEQVDPETGETYYVSEGFGGGCYGEANEEVYGDQSRGWEVLAPELEAMYERIQADPRIQAANEEWSSCMSGAGYDFESEEDLYMTVFEDLQKRFEEIVGPSGGFVDPFEGWSEEEINAFFEEKSEEEINAFFEEAQRQQQTDIDQEALAALQEEERALAVANYECQLPMRDVMEEVSKEYEAAFIRENRDRLEEIRQSQGG